MEKLTIKTPNPICRLFFKIDLLTDFAACVYRFYWRYCTFTHVWYFPSQIVNCYPHGRRNYKDTNLKCCLYWCLIEIID
jgi:hypothetical protein